MSVAATREAERFYVSVQDGYRSERAHPNTPPGSSAAVIDRLNCRRVVALYHSETQRAHRASPEGRRAQAIHLAQLEAARLNRTHSHSERDPARRQ